MKLDLRTSASQV